MEKMIETKLVIRERNPKLFEKLRKMYQGLYLIEISRRGNGNEIYYVIGDENYEKLLWERDNKLNLEGREFIGSSISIKL